MKAEDFAAWLSAISGMNEGQRTEASAALEKAPAVGAEGGGSAKKAGERGRQKDALGTTSVERVVAQGCPHCAGREIVGWGRSHGLPNDLGGRRALEASRDKLEPPNWIKGAIGNGPYQQITLSE